MLKLGKQIVKLRVPILIISFLLLIPSVIIYLNTRINYDILSYLPKDIETMKGQEILVDEFGTGGFSVCVVDGMTEKEIQKLSEKIKKVDHVEKVIWYGSLSDLTVPLGAFPQEVQDAITGKDSDVTLMMITFDMASSDDATLNAVEEIRKITKGQCIQSGMSSVVVDIKKICNTEALMYVVLAAGLSAVVLSLTMDSFLIPVIFLLSIGMVIIYNMGSNFITGEMSFITQALVAVLQLAVTLDYSIFLWHSYQEYREKYPDEKERAMAHAISNTIASVIGSSITTIAGFIAMCFMTFTLGVDLGIVMAKGVVLGVIACVTVLPALILTFDGAIEKTKHRPILPDLGRMSNIITKAYIPFLIVFVIILIPAIWGYNHTDVYYDLVGTLPKDLESVVANSTLQDEFEMGATHMVLFDSNVSSKDGAKMINEISRLDGVKTAVGLDSLLGPTVPKEVIPDTYKEILDNGKYKLVFIFTEYKVASDEVNEQITEIQDIVKKYDDKGMVIGEAPCTKDLIDITDIDFKTVSTVSIVLVFIIILCVLRSVSLPVILVAVIESAIFINMGIPGFTHTTLPFIASIVIGTIQLGATVDYAILMTNKYKKARHNGQEKKEAIQSSLKSSLQSVLVSALSFFAATFGVGLYSSIDMISSLCSLLARGAIISFIVVAFVLPALFMVFDKLIINTSRGFKPAE